MDHKDAPKRSRHFVFTTNQQNLQWITEMVKTIYNNTDNFLQNSEEVIRLMTMIMGLHSVFQQEGEGMDSAETNGFAYALAKCILRLSKTTLTIGLTTSRQKDCLKFIEKGDGTLSEIFREDMSKGSTQDYLKLRLNTRKVLQLAKKVAELSKMVHGKKVANGLQLEILTNITDISKVITVKASIM